MSDISSSPTQSEVAGRLIAISTWRVPREVLGLSCALSRQARRIDTGLKAGYSQERFEDDASATHDWYEYHADPYVGWKASEKTLVSLSGSFGRQITENGLDHAIFARALLGLRMTPSEKTGLMTGVGLQNHETPRRPELGRVSQLHFDAKGTWAVSDRIALRLVGHNEYRPTSAYDNNTKRIDHVAAGLAYELSSRWCLTASYAFRADTYTSPVNGVQEPRQTHSAIQFRSEFAGRREGVTLSVTGRHENFRSNIQNSYNQVRLSVGGSISF